MQYTYMCTLLDVYYIVTCMYMMYMCSLLDLKN